MDHEPARTPSEHPTLTRRDFVRDTSALVAGAALAMRTRRVCAPGSRRASSRVLELSLPAAPGRGG